MQHVYDPATGSWSHFPDDVTSEEIAAAFNGPAAEPMGPAPEPMGPPAPPPRPGWLTALESVSTAIPTPVDVVEKIERALGLTSPPAVGAAIGGMIGARAPGPLSYPAGILGAGIGATIGTGGEILQNLGARASRSLVAALTGPPRRPQPPIPTIREEIAQIPARAGMAMLGQAIGVPAGKVAGGIFGALTALNRPLPPAAQKTLQTAQELHPALPAQMTAGQITEQPSISQLEGLTRHTPLSADIPHAFYQKQRAILQEGWQAFVERIAPDVEKDLETVGRVNAAQGVLSRFKEANAAASRLFQRAYAVVGDTQFPLENFEKSKGQILEEATGLGAQRTPIERQVESLLPATPTPAQAEQITFGKNLLSEAAAPRVSTGMGSPRQMQENLLRAAGIAPEIIAVILDNAPIPGTATLPAMRRIQSGLVEVVRNDQRTGGIGMSNTGRQAALLAAGIGKDITAVRDAHPVLNTLLGEAIDKYKSDVAHVFLNPQIIRTLRSRIGSEANPVENYQSIVPLFFGPNKNVSHLDRLEAAVGPENYRVMAAAAMHNLVNDAVDRQTGEFSLQRFLTASAPYLKTPKMLDRWLGPEAADFRKFIGLSQQIREGTLAGENPSRSGQMVVGALQVWRLLKGVGNLVVGNLPMGAMQVTEAALPDVLARVLFSPRGIRAAVKLTQTTVFTPAADITRNMAVLQAVAMVPSPWEEAQNVQAAEPPPTPSSLRETLSRQIDRATQSREPIDLTDAFREAQRRGAFPQTTIPSQWQILGQRAPTPPS